MITVSKWMMASMLVLAALPMAAQAQTYDFNVTMTGINGAGPTTFSGSFAFNAAGTGGCSAAFCAPGAIPEFTNVNINNPLSSDPAGGRFAFTDATSGGMNLNFVDTYLGTAGQSSFVNDLSLTIGTPLGGSATSIGLDNIEFSTDANGTGTHSCGGSSVLASLGVTCSQASLKVATVKAPEIDSSSAVSALTLLLGALAVLRGGAANRYDGATEPA
ncbi:MAG TPA: hypothetical protein VK676_02650 [Steroidobacteraceae bacterium]|jgi:hypothetical protein|nr:hypothetical protein [Steroidobacteraceae bacterium]